MAKPDQTLEPGRVRYARRGWHTVTALGFVTLHTAGLLYSLVTATKTLATPLTEPLREWMLRFSRRRW